MLSSSTNKQTNMENHITANLSDRAIYQLTGPDAERYLNGQISQDVRLSSASSALYSVVSNFKGKLEGDLYIRRYNNAILIDTDSSQRESLFMRLDKYLIADDAELIDVSDDYTLIFSTEKPDTACWSVPRFGIDGFDTLLEKDQTTASTFTCPIELEAIRISNAVPAWQKELTNDILPADAAIEQRAISFTKGCYTGQEVISRMKSAGKTNRHLVNLESNQNIETPTDLYLTSEDAKPSAVLTSICQQEGNHIGLGYRMRKAESSTTFYTKEGLKVTVSSKASTL